MAVSYTDVETQTAKIDTGNRTMISKPMLAKCDFEIGDYLVWYYDGEKVMIVKPDSDKINGNDSADEFYEMDATLVSKKVRFGGNRKITVPLRFRNLMNVSKGDYIKTVYDGRTLVALPVSKEKAGR